MDFEYPVKGDIRNKGFAVGLKATSPRICRQPCRAVVTRTSILISMRPSNSVLTKNSQSSLGFHSRKRHEKAKGAALCYMAAELQPPFSTQMEDVARELLATGASAGVSIAVPFAASLDRRVPRNGSGSVSPETSIEARAGYFVRCPVLSHSFQKG